MNRILKSLLAAAALLMAGGAQAQNFTEWGNSDPSRQLSDAPTSCGEYYLPFDPCPKVEIKQRDIELAARDINVGKRGDHHTLPQYRALGWDTVITCDAANRNITLSSMPYIPAQYFNGQYTVDAIEYNPPDATFHQGERLDLNCDDIFTVTPTQIAYPFYFFGQRKTQFRLGDNGMITFSTETMSNDHCTSTTTPKPYCPYSISGDDYYLPWKPDEGHTPGGDSYFTRMHDGIYGVYEDTHPLPSTVTAPQGVYYGVLDTFPCRKIVATWNEIPLYNSQTGNRQSYQIVCYEGSNIIEMHIKRRGCCSTTNNGRGYIGIQNATGAGQVKGANGTPNVEVHPNAHAAYYPTAAHLGLTSTQYAKGELKGNLSTTLTNIAIRFTPQGRTQKVYGWYVLNDDGTHDTLPYTDDGVTSYQEKMQGDQTDMYPDWNDASCPSLTLCHMRGLTKTTKVVFWMNFRNANNDWYELSDTITIGVNRNNDLALHDLNSPAAERVHNYCENDPRPLALDFSNLNDTVHTTWHVTRVSGGQEIELPNSVLTFGNEYEVIDDSVKRMFVTLANQLPEEGYRKNKIDSIYIQVSADFNNGCDSNSRLLVRIFPLFDTTVVEKICMGESYYWTADSVTYRTTTQRTAHLHSQPGCDSTVHLDLTVLDVAYIVQEVTDCKPFRWTEGNDSIYSASNAASATGDTVHRLNPWGCEDVYQLSFTLLPVEAKIRSSLESFDYDHLDVELTDISSGSDRRKWILPDGTTQSGTQAYYTIPQEASEAEFQLVAFSTFGECTDTTSIVLPFNKETVYMPNIFTPDNREGNYLFGAHSTNTLTYEMFIYNRRGELVYSCNNVNCTWDGKNLNGQACPQGAYVYFIRYTNTFEPDRTHVLRGTVTLVR